MVGVVGLKVTMVDLVVARLFIGITGVGALFKELLVKEHSDKVMQDLPVH